MDVKLGEIIEKIKSEGVNQGKLEADELLSQAKQEAQRIIDSAQSQADTIVQDAKQESQSILERGISALQQAERDLILVVKQKLSTMIGNFIKQRVSQTLSSEATLELIKTALSKWNKEANEALFVHISQEDAQKISSASFQDFMNSVQSIEIKVDKQLSKGFAISKNEQGSLSYDFSEQAISQSLANFLTQNIQELLRIDD